MAGGHYQYDHSVNSRQINTLGNSLSISRLSRFIGVFQGRFRFMWSDQDGVVPNWVSVGHCGYDITAAIGLGLT